MTGEDHTMSDAASEHLAPVTYLPWVRPDAEATSRPAASRQAPPTAGAQVDAPVEPLPAPVDF